MSTMLIRAKLGDIKRLLSDLACELPNSHIYEFIAEDMFELGKRAGLLSNRIERTEREARIIVAGPNSDIEALLKAHTVATVEKHDANEYGQPSVPASILLDHDTLTVDVTRCTHEDQYDWETTDSAYGFPIVIVATQFGSPERDVERTIVTYQIAARFQIEERV